MQEVQSVVAAPIALPVVGTKVELRYDRGPFQSLASTTGPHKLWETFQRWITVASEDEAFWWKVTGSHLATLMAMAGYTVNEQCEALLFHSQRIIPSLGPQPTPGKPKWKSFMTDDLSPIEYSWKWGYDSQAPEIRYGIEAIGPYAGTAIDKRNQLQTHELMHTLNRTLTSIDLTWYRLLQKELFGGDISVEEMTAQSSLFLAFEMIRGELGVKAYFIPQDKPGESCTEQIFRAVSVACGDRLSAVNAVRDYLSNDVGGTSLQPFMVAIDCVPPEQSRIKVYVRSKRTSFDFVTDVMTIGGRRKGLEKSIDEFHELWKLTLGLGSEHTSDRDLPNFRHETSGTCFYFDVQPGAPAADVKAYIPVRHYASSDEQVARGLRQFLAKRGRDRFFAGYERALQELGPREGLATRCGVQTYISCAFQKDRISMTSYLSPQIFALDRSSGGSGRWAWDPLADKKRLGRVRFVDW